MSYVVILAAVVSTERGNRFFPYRHLGKAGTTNCSAEIQWELIWYCLTGWSLEKVLGEPIGVMTSVTLAYPLGAEPLCIPTLRIMHDDLQAIVPEWHAQCSGTFEVVVLPRVGGNSAVQPHSMGGVRGGRGGRHTGTHTHTHTHITHTHTHITHTGTYTRMLLHLPFSHLPFKSAQIARCPRTLSVNNLSLILTHTHTVGCVCQVPSPSFDDNCAGTMSTSWVPIKRGTVRIFSHKACDPPGLLQESFGPFRSVPRMSPRVSPKTGGV